MPTLAQPFVVHPARGGLDTTKISTLLGPEDLTVADNIEYDTSGTRRKRLGTSRYNATQITETGTPITFTDLADYWRFNTTDGTWTQRLVATGGTQTWKDDLDGVWDSLTTSWGSDTANSNIILAQNLAVFANDVTGAPRKWDQTTEAALGGTPPTFAFGTYHLRRLFVAGMIANPSQVTYSAAGNIETWSGADSGNLIFDDDDGDRVMAVSQPFRTRLYIFKGPHRGSIHHVTGTTASDFARAKLFDGLACVSTKSVVTTPNDIFWASRFGIHSLRATDKFGDVEEAFISRPIQANWRALSQTDARLGAIVGFYHPFRNIVGWCVPASGASTNTRMFVYNVALGTWSIWAFSGLNPACARVLLTPATAIPRLYVGGYTGRVYSGDQTTLSDDNADQAYTATIRTPVYLDMGEVAGQLQEKSLVAVTTFFRPKGNFNATLRVLVDNTATSYNVSMAGGGDTLT